ncbi:speckle-type POZ protein-like [Microplitis mediator]|uniref:speckle-type POZ protein-like n=1 Tax=Microplitis mediator TaxID=375433 RepID=UPI0025552255|nr:speckle-type POZ protein-like [Microplitis mediator]
MERGYTTISENNIVYKWKIDQIDFIITSQTDFTFNSSEFSSRSKVKDRWCLKSIFDSTEYVDFYLCLKSDHHDLKTKFSFFLLDSKKEKVYITKYQELFSKGERKCYSLGKQNLLDKKNRNLPGDTLTVGIDLTVYGSPITISTKFELNIPKRPMAHDFTELYNSGIGSDVVINVGGTNFEAHKSILMARSPVFAAMFSHDMIEKKESKISISIPDITPRVFEKVLEYIYTDKVTGLDEINVDLLKAADKYQLRSLKNICQASLGKILTLENAFYLMALADLYNATHLLEFTTNFLVLNIKNVIDNPDFEEFEKSHLSLALKLTKRFISKK